MPTRISCMYAGSSGSSRNLNMMSEGNGNNKWQGLPGLTNLRSSLVVPVKTRAYGTNRDKVFCLNQLGGIGQDCQGGNLTAAAPNLSVILTSDPKDAPIFYFLENLVSIPTSNGTRYNDYWLGNLSNYTPDHLASKLYEIYNEIPKGSNKLDETSNSLLQGYNAYAQTPVMYVPFGVDCNSSINASNGFSMTEAGLPQGYPGDPRCLALLVYTPPSVLKNPPDEDFPSVFDSNGFVKSFTPGEGFENPKNGFELLIMLIPFDELREQGLNTDAGYSNTYIVKPVNKKNNRNYSSYISSLPTSVTPQYQYPSITDIYENVPYKLVLPIFGIDQVTQIVSGNYPLDNLNGYVNEAMKIVEKVLFLSPNLDIQIVPLFIKKKGEVFNVLLSTLYVTGLATERDQIGAFMIENNGTIRKGPPGSQEEGRPLIRFLDSPKNVKTLFTGVIDGL